MYISLSIYIYIYVYYMYVCVYIYIHIQCLPPEGLRRGPGTGRFYSEGRPPGVPTGTKTQGTSP